VIDFAYDATIKPHKFVFNYNQNVAANVTLQNLRLHKIGVNSDSDEPLSKFAELAAGGGTSVATITTEYSASETAGVGRILPDGNYDLALNLPGNQPPVPDEFLPDPEAEQLYFYNGDFNRDRVVNLDDFTALAAGFGAPGTFTNGDASFNGIVDLDDFTFLAARFGTGLSKPPAGANSLVVDSQPNTTTLLQWQAPANVTGILGYKIWRSFDGVDFGFAPIFTVTDPLQTSWVDGLGTPGSGPALPDATKIWYRLRAYTVSGNLATTNKEWAVTTLPAPDQLSATAVSSTQIDLAWRINSQNHTEFRVDRSINGQKGWTQIGTSTTNSFSDTIAAPGTTYFYRVRAWSPQQSSSPSLSASATTQPAVPPTPPIGLTATYQPASLRIDANWADNPEPGVKYNLYRSTVESFILDATTLLQSNLTASSFSDMTVSPSTRYFYGITAVFSQGPELEASESVCVSYASTMTQINAQPTNIVLSLADEATIDLFWSDQSGNETSYDVYHRGGVFADWTLAASLPTDATFFTDTGLEEDTEYEYRIDARHSAATAPAPTSQPATTRFGFEYRGLIQIFLGLGARPGFNEGLEQLAKKLRDVRVFTAGGELGYRVKLYSSTPNNILANGDGRASDEFDDALFDGVQDFAILGHSYGGGATFLLADNVRFATNPGGIVANLRYTGYVDAIQLASLSVAEVRRPPNSLWHENYYQEFPGIHGQGIPTSNVDHRVTNAEHGSVISHTTIDNSIYVHTQVVNSIKNKMPLNTIQ